MTSTDIITRPLPRVPFDQYPTPGFQTRALLHHVPDIAGTVLEPCSGDGAIASILRAHPGVEEIVSNDLDPAFMSMIHMNAADPAIWDVLKPSGIDWVITNPPFPMPTCLQIVQYSVEAARVGAALLLPISFLEPTPTRNPRGPWLEDHPPDRLIVLPRHSYRDNGRSAGMTTAWFVWYPGGVVASAVMRPPIVCAHNAKALYT